MNPSKTWHYSSCAFMAIENCYPAHRALMTCYLFDICQAPTKWKARFVLHGDSCVWGMWIRGSMQHGFSCTIYKIWTETRQGCELMILFQSVIKEDFFKVTFINMLPSSLQGFNMPQVRTIQPCIVNIYHASLYDHHSSLAPMVLMESRQVFWMNPKQHHGCNWPYERKFSNGFYS